MARIAGVPVDRVLRYAGPVLQERAMLAQHARRTRLKTSEKGATLAEVVDARLSQHGVDMEKISWDAYRRDDGTWRVVATWPSGKANATAVWELDKARQLGGAAGRHGALPVRARRRGRRHAHRGHEVGAAPGRTAAGTSRSIAGARAEPRPGRDPIRAGRDALLASLERPLGDAGRRRSLDPIAAPAAVGRLGRGQRRVPRRRRAARAVFDDDRDAAIEMPAVPSLAVLRPRRDRGRRPTGDRRPAGQARPELGRRALRRRAHRQGRLSAQRASPTG